MFIQDQSFNNFKNDKMKLSVIEGKLAGSWARNCAGLDFKICLRDRKV